MFRVILATQWKWTRGALLIATCAAFALPLLSIRNASTALEEMNARDLLAIMNTIGMAYGLTAGSIGLVIAAMAWTPDHAGRHVYALALPLARWKYVAMRFAAGALTLTAPVIALWIGGVVAIASIQIPAGLHSHAAALTIRFALATLVAYATFFAISSGTKRTAGLILSTLAGALILELVGEALNLPLRPFFLFVDFVMNWSGTLGVFNGPWMLIDV